MAVCKIKGYNVAPTESFFFDTNVWIFIFAPIAGSQQYKQRIYSGLFNEILSRKATIWVSSLIISEYVNAVLKFEFKQWKRRNKLINADYKHDFRPTVDFKTALEDVRAQVADILRVCERRPDNFNSIDVDSIITDMGNCSYDFVDSMIVDLCNRNREIKLVTDDTDISMSDTKFTVLTV